MFQKLIIVMQMLIKIVTFLKQLVKTLKVCCLVRTLIKSKNVLSFCGQDIFKMFNLVAFNIFTR